MPSGPAAAWAPLKVLPFSGLTIGSRGSGGSTEGRGDRKEGSPETDIDRQTDRQTEKQVGRSLEMNRKYESSCLMQTTPQIPSSFVLVTCWTSAGAFPARPHCSRATRSRPRWDCRWEKQVQKPKRVSPCQGPGQVQRALRLPQREKPGPLWRFGSWHGQFPLSTQAFPGSPPPPPVSPVPPSRPLRPPP